VYDLVKSKLDITNLLLQQNELMLLKRCLLNKDEFDILSHLSQINVKQVILYIKYQPNIKSKLIELIQDKQKEVKNKYFNIIENYDSNNFCKELIDFYDENCDKMLNISHTNN